MTAPAGILYSIFGHLDFVSRVFEEYMHLSPSLDHEGTERAQPV